VKLVTVQFNHHGRQNFKLLLDVFVKSVRKNMPNVKIVQECIDAPERDTSHARNLLNNSVKLEIWNRHMQEENENVIFADCDILCNASAWSAFQTEFDVALTFKPVKSGFPMNGGIVFARPTDGAREFFAKWLEINSRMYNDPNFHIDWKQKYGGMNQAAFGYIYEKNECPGVNIARLSTRDYNAVECDWGHITDETAFIHYKSKLRHMILSGHKPYGVYAEAMKRWYEVRNSGV
jgi:hypothetical protein